MVIYDDPRYSQVPWISTSADLRPMGRPETSIELPNDHTDGLRIVAPFGKDSDALIAIRAVRGDGTDGGMITLAITTTVIRSTADVPSDVAGMPVQSNPRRHEDTGDAA